MPPEDRRRSCTEPGTLVAEGPKQNEPKNHHFVPQLLLREFCDDAGLLWVFDRESNELRHQHPRETGAEKHLYTRTTEKGLKDASLESGLMSELDGRAAAPLRKLATHQELTLEERYYLAVFFSFLCVRGPDFVASLQELVDKTGKAMLKELNRFGGLERGAAKKGLPPEAVRQFIEDEQFTVKAPKEFALGHMVLGAAEKIGPHYFVSAWALAEAPRDCCFITADVPYSMVSMDPSRPSGLIAPGTVRLIPISPRQAVVIGPPIGVTEITHAPVSRDLVRNVNQDLAMGSDRFIYGRDKAHVQFLAKRNRLAEWRRSERTDLRRVSTGDERIIVVAHRETPDKPPGVDPMHPARSPRTVDKYR